MAVPHPGPGRNAGSQDFARASPSAIWAGLISRARRSRCLAASCSLFALARTQPHIRAQHNSAGALSRCVQQSQRTLGLRMSLVRGNAIPVHGFTRLLRACPFLSRTLRRVLNCAFDITFFCQHLPLAKSLRKLSFLRMHIEQHLCPPSKRETRANPSSNRFPVLIRCFANRDAEYCNARRMRTQAMSEEESAPVDRRRRSPPRRRDSPLRTAPSMVAGQPERVPIACKETLGALVFTSGRAASMPGRAEYVARTFLNHVSALYLRIAHARKEFRGFAERHLDHVRARHFHQTRARRSRQIADTGLGSC